jgi:hypothetical protein
MDGLFIQESAFQNDAFQGDGEIPPEPQGPSQGGAISVSLGIGIN